MDKNKTGQVIADARKQRKLTQKDLAEMLHVSDRAVSKWERGAGFPDVSLLEPLANALHVTVLDLLRGENSEESNIQTAVQEALTAYQEKRRQSRRYVCREAAKALAVLLAIGTILAWMFPLTRDVTHTVTAGVYVDGVLAAYTEVEIDGEISHNLVTGGRSYWGRFAIDCVEWTTREQANGGLSLNGEDGLIYSMGGTLTGDLFDTSTVINEEVTEFAFALQSPNHLLADQTRAEKWCILATSPEMYEAYCAQMGNSPPGLKAGETAVLPEFPSAWNQNLKYGK